MKTSNSIAKFIIGSAILVTLIITPWLNVDSMIIPKIIILSLTAAYFLPNLVYVSISNLYKMNWLSKILQITVILIILQMLLVMFFTEAPIEQQFFGKTGRGLGFLTYFALLVLLIMASRVFQLDNLKFISHGLFFTSFVTSIYSILQYYGFDIFNWTTRTNGIIGTIGNPNFQSSFSAIALLSSLVYYSQKAKKKILFGAAHSAVLLYTIYLCKSWQGYILVIVSLWILVVYYLKLKNSILFWILLPISFTTGVLAVLGMTKVGPLSEVLYKYSIKSRGEMWRSSISALRDNPVFGVGLDSFGDFSLLYKNPVDVGGVNEFTDNSHNYYLEFATTGGFLLLVLNIVIIAITLYSFLKLLRRKNNVDFVVLSLFAAWICYISQSVISPASIPILIWNYVISGAIIGIASGENLRYLSNSQKTNSPNLNILSLRLIFLALTCALVYPYFNVDRLHLLAARKGDALLAVQVAQMYPESVLRYQRIGRELLESNLYDQALEVGRAATEFNPNSFSAWALIYLNMSTPGVEREKALEELKRIDPLNPEFNP
jgi:O-antigen ligase